MACSSSSAPPAACLFYNNDDDVIEYGEPRHSFLESCFLCRKSLAGNRDIFMYRGDTAFCSEECRQEQIAMDDEVQEKKRWKQSFVKTSEKKKKSARIAEDPRRCCGGIMMM